MNRVSNAEGERIFCKWCCVEDVEGWMEDIACEVEVRVRAWVISCLSFA